MRQTFGWRASWIAALPQTLLLQIVSPQVVGWLGIMSVVAIAPAQAGELTQWSFDPITNRLEVVTSANVTPRHLLMAQPARIILDLPNTQLGAIATQKSYTTGAIRQIRVSQYQANITRIVLELAPDTVLDPRQVELDPIDGSGRSAQRWTLRPLLAGGNSAAATIPTPVSPPVRPTSVPPTTSPTTVRPGSPTIAVTTTPSTSTAALPPSTPASEQGITIVVPPPETPTAPVSNPVSNSASSSVTTSPATTNGLPTLGSSPAPVATPSIAVTAPRQPIATPPSPRFTPPPVQLPAPASRIGVTAQAPAEAFPPTVKPPSQQVIVVVPPLGQSAIAQPTPTVTTPSASIPVVVPTVGLPTITATPRATSSNSLSSPSLPTVAATPTQPTVAPPPQPILPTELPPTAPPPSPPAVSVPPPTARIVPPPVAPIAPVAAAPTGATTIDFGRPLPISRTVSAISLPPASANSKTVPPIVPFGTMPMFRAVTPGLIPPPPTASPSNSSGVVYVAVSTNIATPGILLPTGTVLSLRYPGTSTLSLQASASRQEVLLLQTEIRNASGQVILPAGTPVIGQFQLSAQGGQFVTQAIVLSDRNIPLTAQSELLFTPVLQPNQTLQISLTDTLKQF